MPGQSEGNIKVIKTYRQDIPATRFIGIKYGDEDKVGGMFGTKWQEWFQTGKFGPLLNSAGESFFEDSGACIGLMRWKEGEPFQYWIGMFTKPETAIPDGYGFIDFPSGKLAVAWLQGHESDIFSKDEFVMKAFEANGITMGDLTPADGTWWFFERYADDRFKTDENGNTILDYCYFIK